MNPNQQQPFDALDTAEQFTGKDSATDKATVGLGFLLLQESAAKKKAALLANGDTPFSTTIAEYRAVAERIGFVERACFAFKGREGQDERLYVFSRPDGLVLKLESYSWNDGAEPSTNTADLYFQLEPPRYPFTESPNSSGSYNGSDEMWALVEVWQTARAFLTLASSGMAIKTFARALLLDREA